MSDSDSHGSH